MAAAEAPSEPTQPPRASDVMAFGQETGRVLSDGTIVGRAEPFTKVFTSSRAVKREVGLTAWAILEDIALDARIDDGGRLVAETNVRRIAEHLDLSKNTVSGHLKTLREAGFTVREETRAASGAWGASRYVLDPSACLERFTTTPTEQDDEADGGDTEGVVVDLPVGGDSQPTGVVDNSAAGSPDRRSDAESGALSPCTSSWDTVAGTVSQFMGHRELGHNNQQEHACEEQPLQQQHQQNSERDREPDRGQLLEALLAAEVEPEVADRLLDEHALPAVRDALAVVAHREVDNPAGWVVTAVREGWELAEEADELRASQRRRQRQANQAEARDRRRRQTEAGLDRAEAWHRAISGALDDGQLAEVVCRLAEELPDLVTGSMPVVRAELTRLAVAACRHHPDEPLPAAIEQIALPGPPSGDGLEELPEPPPARGDPPLLGERIRSVLNELPSTATEQKATR